MRHLLAVATLIRVEVGSDARARCVLTRSGNAEFEPPTSSLSKAHGFGNFRILNLFTNREPIASQIIFQCCKSETQWKPSGDLVAWIFLFALFGTKSVPVRCTVGTLAGGLRHCSLKRVLESKL